MKWSHLLYQRELNVTATHKRREVCEEKKTTTTYNGLYKVNTVMVTSTRKLRHAYYTHGWEPALQTEIDMK